jgi:ribonuclease P protein component
MPAAPRVASVSASSDPVQDQPGSGSEISPAGRHPTGGRQAPTGAAAAMVLPASFVEGLIRSRPSGSTLHFSIHWKTLPDSQTADTRAAQTADTPKDADSGNGVLFLSVPKRLLKRAIDRNLVRRIIRECWRGAGLPARRLAVLVKMRSRPVAFGEPGVRHRRQALREELSRLFGRSDSFARESARMSGNLRGDPRGRVLNR